MICVDGGTGLLQPGPDESAQIAVQRCWAHKIRNVLNKARKADQPRIKRALHKIIHAANAPAARSAAPRFAKRFQYPAAVSCLRNDLDELLTCFRYKTEAERRAVRTTNAIERRFREVRRRDTGQWEPSRTKQAWTASCSPSLPTKICHRASAPPSC